MLRIIIKIILFPVTILLTVSEWIFSLATGISGIFFRLIAGILILTGLLSFGFGLESWSVAVRIMLVGVVFLTIPLAAAVFTAGISALNMMIRTI